MNERLEFIGKPVQKPRMTRADSWKKRPIVLRYWEFKDEINKQAGEQEFELAEQYRALIFVEMPKSWSKKKKEAMNLTKHRQRPDWDNFAKGFQDALSKEDSNVWHADVYKIWSYEPKLIIKNIEKDLDIKDILLIFTK